MDRSSLSDIKYVLVTGAAGGLGEAAARELASRGYHVLAADIKPAESAENITPVVMDVMSEESVAEAAELVSKSCGGLYAILHLAGVYTMDSFIEIEEATLERMLEVNLMGVYRVNKAFLPLVQKGGGRIAIVTSELAPLDPLPFNGIYTMTKNALDSYSRSLALELQLLGVRVITLRPGAFGDGMPKAAVRSMERMEKKTELYPGVAKRFKKIVVGKTGSAKDTAVFAKWAADITGKKKPRFIYAKNRSPLLLLFSALPMRLQAFALKKLLSDK